MRIAALIVGLMFAFGEFTQTVLVGTVSKTASDSGAAGFGLFGAFFLLLGAALAIPFPRAAMALFALAAVSSFGGYAADGAYGDLTVWGTLAAVLVVFAYLGHRGKVKAERRQRAEREELLAAMRGHALPPSRA